jgi:hypothetical protein
MKSSSDILENSLFVVTPAGSRTFQGPLVMASLTAFPGNGGELHHKLAPSSGASSTDSPLSPTLPIDTPDTLLTSQGLLPPKTHSKSLVNCAYLVPTLIVVLGRVRKQRDTNSPATGNSHKISCSRKTNRTRQNCSELRATFEIILPNSTSSSSF